MPLASIHLGSILNDSVSSGFAAHWIDGLVATLLSVVGYLFDARLRAIETCIKALEEDIKKINGTVSHHAERLARVEAFRTLPRSTIEQED